MIPDRKLRIACQNAIRTMYKREKKPVVVVFDIVNDKVQTSQELTDYLPLMATGNFKDDGRTVKILSDQYAIMIASHAAADRICEGSNDSDV